jgi:hypothetical protein
MAGTRTRDDDRIVAVGRVDDIFRCQFFQSLFSMTSVIGEPSVSPHRTPDVTRASSFSIFMRPPRP